MTNKLEKPVLLPWMLYISGQLEICPTTGKTHWQYCFYTRSAYTHEEMKKKLSKIGIDDHFEVSRNPTAVKKYCKKSETSVKDSFFEEGDMPKQGARVDLQELADKIRNGEEPTDVEEMQYGPMIARLRAKMQEEYSRKPRLDLRVEVLIGEPGTGKTRYAYDNYGYENVYAMRLHKGKEPTFNGYRGQKVLLIEEFEDQMNVKELLRFLDIYPVLLEVKYAHGWACWHTVIITSNVKINEWWGGCIRAVHKRALLRRIHHVSSLDEETEVSDSNTDIAHSDLDSADEYEEEEEEQQVPVRRNNH